MTERDRDRNAWAAAQLRALRAESGLTQERLAEEAGIDRSALVNLEKGNRRLTPYYASRLAGPLKTQPESLLPPHERAGQDLRAPLDRLAELEAEVARLRAERDFALREVVARLVALEAAQVSATLEEAPGSSQEPGQ